MKLLYEVCREVNRLIVQYIIHRQYTTHQYSNIMYAIGYTVATYFDRKRSSSGQ